jgi:glycerophosphoryl diester phosphodiesterase
VDGKLSNGRWLPMTAKELNFSSTAGKFEGNSLYIDSSFKEPKVTVKAVLKENPALSKEITIYIKTHTETERLKTVDELMETWKKEGKDKKKKKG